MKDGIEADKWYGQDLSIDFMVHSVQFAEYTIFYQNIIKSICFFIGHKGFEQDLIYIPICQYASKTTQNPDIAENNKRLYAKMNKKD